MASDALLKRIAVHTMELLADLISVMEQAADQIAEGQSLKDISIKEYQLYIASNEEINERALMCILSSDDYFDLLNGSDIHHVFKELKAKVLVLAFKSDWLYPAYQSLEIAKACKLAGVDATYCEIHSTYGHDSFLLETEEETHLIKHFLKTVSNGFEG